MLDLSASDGSGLEPQAASSCNSQSDAYPRYHPRIALAAMALVYNPAACSELEHHRVKAEPSVTSTWMLGMWGCRTSLATACMRRHSWNRGPFLAPRPCCFCVYRGAWTMAFHKEGGSRGTLLGGRDQGQGRASPGAVEKQNGCAFLATIQIQKHVHIFGTSASRSNHPLAEPFRARDCEVQSLGSRPSACGLRRDGASCIAHKQGDSVEHGLTCMCTKGSGTNSVNPPVRFCVSLSSSRCRALKVKAATRVDSRTSTPILYNLFFTCSFHSSISFSRGKDIATP